MASISATAKLGSRGEDPYLKNPNYDPLAKYRQYSLSNTDRLATTLSSDTVNASAAASASSALSFNSSASSTVGHVGFASLPNQIHRRAVRRGFEFNLMVVGESGLGKSTLLNSLFLSELYNADHVGPSKRIKKTVCVESHTVLLKENSVNLRLNLIDTPGFGDAVDNTNCWCPIVDYIDARFEEHLTAEQKVNRGQLLDNRVHCVLYFIAPTGHGLKPLDIEFMRRIADKANVVPVLAKADCMTADEVREFKKAVLADLAQHKIRIYDFPDCPTGPTGDEEEAAKLKPLKYRIPFAVVGANCVAEGGRAGAGTSRSRARVYPWGTVDVDSLEHNDFAALRSLIMRTHMQDLREVTSVVHYENYRFSKLCGIAQDSKFKTTDGKDPMAQMETEKRDHELKLKKMEAEMESVFEMKVKEKKQKLKDSELDLQRRADQMRKQLEQQAAELDERRRQFEAEKRAWEAASAAPTGAGGGAGEDASRARSLETGGASGDTLTSGKKGKSDKIRFPLFSGGK